MQQIIHLLTVVNTHHYSAVPLKPEWGEDHSPAPNRDHDYSSPPKTDAIKTSTTIGTQTDLTYKKFEARKVCKH